MLRSCLSSGHACRPEAEAPRAVGRPDLRRGSYDLTGRVYASGAMGVPLALHVLAGDTGERVVYGDTEVGARTGAAPDKNSLPAAAGTVGSSWFHLRLWLGLPACTFPPTCLRGQRCRRRTQPRRRPRGGCPSNAPPRPARQGATVLLLCGGRELPARDLISTDEHKARQRVPHTLRLSAARRLPFC